MSAIQQMLLTSGGRITPKIRASTGIYSAAASGVSIPAVSCEIGDLILLFIFTGGPPYDTPAGYTYLLSIPSTTNLSSDPYRDAAGRVFYKIASEDDTPTTVSSTAAFSMGAKLSIESAGTVSFLTAEGSGKSTTGTSVGLSIPTTSKTNSLYLCCMQLGKNLSGAYTISSYSGVPGVTIEQIEHKNQTIVAGFVNLGMTLISAELVDARSSVTSFTATTSTAVYNTGGIATIVLST